MSKIQSNPANGRIAILGGGPAGLVLAIALGRRGVASVVFERDIHPEQAPRFNADRSYTIDISGHGLKALRYIEATGEFDKRMLPFKGLVTPQGMKLEWTLPGWTGSRGDIVRSLTAAAGRHGDLIDIRYGTTVEAVDVAMGAVTVAAGGARRTEVFDLIVAADGAGSVLRADMERRVPGFTTVRKTFPNYCTMIELDRVGDRLDPHYLHGLSIAPFCVAGAIMGDEGPLSYRWFCAVGTKHEAIYASAAEARAYFERHIPRVLDFTSEDKIAAFAKRKCYHIGQKLTCSQFHGGKAVLIGDAAAPFPPIGQGVNAAMESAIVLDQAIGRTGAAPADLIAAARAYSADWKPESDAVSWMSEKSLFENRFHMFRVQLAVKLGVNMFEEAKSASVPYSAVKEKADKLWPLWA